MPMGLDLLQVSGHGVDLRRPAMIASGFVWLVARLAAALAQAGIMSFWKSFSNVRACASPP